MSKESRFDKLEQARRPAESSSVKLSRFENEAPARVIDEAPVERPELKRFEEDGAAGLHLDRDALAELPMLQCPSCKRDSSKWDQACIYCQTSLTSNEAVTYNLQLVETRRLAADTELEIAREKREAAMAATVNEKASLILNEAKRQTEESSLRRQVICALVALPAFILVWAVDGYAEKGFFFLVFVAALAGALARRI